MFKILFLIIILFIFITIYSYKKRIDNILDSIFPKKEQKNNKENKELEELVQCNNCGVYIPKSSAIKKIQFRGENLYFCSQKCKDEYKHRR